jgi:hypothetical protein
MTMTIKDNIEATLASFRTPHDVRMACQQAGIKGQMHDGSRCILARYLQREHNIPANDLLVGEDVVVFNGIDNNVYESFELPYACIVAAKMFDEGHWPELVEEE